MQFLKNATEVTKNTRDNDLNLVFVFEFWVLRFRVLGASFSRFGCFVFEFWVLRFRVLGASFSI